jgi:outer membrane biosynthesis protein TonB
MLEVLLESRGVKEPRPVFETLISAAVHAAIVLAFIVAAPRLVHELSDELSQKLTFLIPVDRGSPSPEQHLTYMAIGGGVADEGLPRAETKTIDPKGEFALPQITGTPTDPNVPIPVPIEPQVADNAYSVVEVDSAAVRDTTSAAPAYPHVMMIKRIEGYAAMRFVVDSTGLIDMGTVELLQATNAEFVQAVRDAMPRMRFRPAKMGVLAVRQLAEQLFKFEMRIVASSTKTSAKKP